VWGQLKRYHSVRNKMAHLCCNLQAYLMFEVLERAWTQFNARLADVSDLDSLIGAPYPDLPHGHAAAASLWGPCLSKEGLRLRL
jgi:hypothetical protein